MNSCVLMAEIVSEPQLRTTQDNLDVAEMIVRFDGLRDEDPPATIKVLGWGNLASEIKSSYTQGDHIVIEGRLSMNTIEMREGYKEKKAELVASRIFPVGQSTGYSPSTIDATESGQKYQAPRNTPEVATSSDQQPSPTTQPRKTKTPQPSSPAETASAPASTSTSPDNADWDEIPF